jgi:mannitol-1-phosphate/altronate dehydrogenase
MRQLSAAALPGQRAVTDPALPDIARAAARAGHDSAADVAALLALGQIVPPRIAAQPGLARALATQVAAIATDGARATRARHTEAVP